MGKFKILTTLFGVSIVLFGLFTMASSQADDTRTFDAKFDNVVGLNNHSTVTYKGVRVGEVVAIAPYDTTGQYAKVKIALDRDAKIDMRADASMVLRLKTILGELFLDLDPGVSQQAFKGELTRTHRDTSLDQILFQGAALYDDVAQAGQTKQIVDDLKSVVQSSGGDIQVITHNTRTIVDGLTNRVGQVNTIITNLDQLTAATDGKAGKLGEAVVEVNKIVSQLRDTLVRNNERIKNLLNTINNLVVTADLTQLDEQLAKAPGYLDKMDRGVFLLRSFLNARLPLFSNLIAYRPDAAKTALGDMKNLHDNNPLLASLLAGVIKNYLAGY